MQLGSSQPELLTGIPSASHQELAEAYERYMVFAGVYTDNLLADQLSRDRKKYEHLLVFSKEGLPCVSDERCAEFMSSVTGLPYELCLAWEAAEFVGVHGDIVASKSRQRRRAEMDEITAEVDHIYPYPS